MASEKAILYDATRCIACKGCQLACKQWNQNPGVPTEYNGYENPPTLGAYTWMRILFNEKYEDGEMHWYFTKQQCMHCTEAACVEVCPPQATTHREYKLSDGSTVTTVATDPDKCIGCNYCRVACPFDVPGYGQKEKGIFRCTMCVDRLTSDVDLRPACVKSCPSGALDFGDRQEMLEKAEARVTELKSSGVSKARVYGKDELGGLRYIYVLADEPESYQLPNEPSIPAGTKVWNALTKPWGAVAAGGIVLALVLNGVINARNSGLERKFREDHPEV
jgi:formate dehydrogenase iron-sulfur subunit